MQTVTLVSIVYAAREEGERTKETIAVIDSRILDLIIWHALTRCPLNECSKFWIKIDNRARLEAIA